MAPTISPPTATDARLTLWTTARISREPTRNLEAHNSYLLGMFYWNKRTGEGFKRAIEHFERAIALSEGRDASAKVLFARQYARLVFDRPLHDRLLNEVLAQDPHAPGLTLSNVLAREQAEALLAAADDYF